MSEAIVPKGQPTPGDPEKKGWLFKWTNYLKGYQRRWFVLSNGLLSYYRNQAEMAHTCRGTISLMGALIHTADSCTFVISNGGTQTFHIRAHDEVERQSWVTALELAKAKAIRAQESDDEEEQMGGHTAAPGGGEGENEDAGGLARELAARFHDLRTCSELVARHGAALQRELVDLEIPPSDTSKQVSERATLFRISCNAMMNACSEFMSAASASSTRMTRALQHERDQKTRLQEVVEQLARQHDNLEKTVTAHGSTGQSGGQGNEVEDEDHEFFDAMEEGVSTAVDDKGNSFVMKVPINKKKKAGGGSSDESDGEVVTETQQVIFLQDKDRPESSMGGAAAVAGAKVVVWPHASEVASLVDGHPRRLRVPDRPNFPLSLWSIMKNCIGKELSKIPIPVNFSEPLSMLQRLTEDYEYSSVLDEAAQFTDPAQQLAYVAAFTVSAYANTANRTNKPFNPLLGETFECDRMADLGWRSISEQVSHHPPMLAQHCAGVAGWQCWQEFTMTTKFRGKYLQVVPLGGASVRFADGNTFSWRKVQHHPPMMVVHCASAAWMSFAAYSVSSQFRGVVIFICPETDFYVRFNGSGNQYTWGKVGHQPATMALHWWSHNWTGGMTVSAHSTFTGPSIIFSPNTDIWVVFSKSGNFYQWRRVAYNPSTAAAHCSGSDWSGGLTLSSDTCFTGTTIECSPDAESWIIFSTSGNRYEWPRVTTTVHNIIVGKLWVDNHGDMDITGEAGAATGYVAHLKYQPYGYFSKETQRKVTGVIKDPQGVPRYVLQGYWDSRVEVAPVTSASPDNTVCKTGKFTVAWQRVEPPPDAESWYNFTVLAAQLNEMEEGVAPTDSRRRPDQRLMEEGLWDEANAEKLRLEEKQRTSRRALEAAAEAAAVDGSAAPELPQPLWFTRSAGPGAPQLRHLYNDTYWQCKQRQDWARCPNIF